MPSRPSVPVVKVEDLLGSFRERQRLIGLVRSLSKEVERLDEDNVQLRVAVRMYREVVRRFHLGQPGRFQGDGKPRQMPVASQRFEKQQTAKAS